MLKRIAVVVLCFFVFCFLLPACWIVAIASAVFVYEYIDLYRMGRVIDEDTNFEKTVLIVKLIFCICVAVSAAFSLFLIRRLWPEKPDTGSSDSSSD